MRHDRPKRNDPSNETVQETFGRSMESHAQIHDAEAVAGTRPGEILNVYRLIPLAAPDDPNWDNAPSLGEVVVAARTSGDARVVAAAAELDYMEIDSLPAEGVTTAMASAFRNDKLYTVVEVEHGRRDLLRGILEGPVPVDTIKPIQT